MTKILIATMFTVLIIICYFLYKSETRSFDLKELSQQKIKSSQYPWFNTDTVTKVKFYKETYKYDSNDWIAQFKLNITEAEALSSKLPALAESQKNYRCNAGMTNWKLKYDVCNYAEMVKVGFKAYLYNPSLCPAGCKQFIVLWINIKNGRSYIVGTPDNT